MNNNQPIIDDLIEWQIQRVWEAQQSRDRVDAEREAQKQSMWKSLYTNEMKEKAGHATIGLGDRSLGAVELPVFPTSGESRI